MRSVSHSGAETSETKRMVIVTMGDHLHSWRISFLSLSERDVRNYHHPCHWGPATKHKAAWWFLHPVAPECQWASVAVLVPSILCNDSPTVSLCNIGVTGRRSECRMRQPGGDGEKVTGSTSQRAKSGTARKAQKTQRGAGFTRGIILAWMRSQPRNRTMCLHRKKPEPLSLFSTWQSVTTEINFEM